MRTLLEADFRILPSLTNTAPTRQENHLEAEGLIAKIRAFVIYCRSVVMLLRIIIPTYNGEKTVAQTVDHLLAQIKDASNISILIIPNGCTDRTREKIGKFKREKVVEVHPLDDASKILAINSGASLSKGYKYLAFMDDDCRVSRGCVLAGIKTLEANPSLHTIALRPKGLINSPTPWGRVWQRIFSQATEHRFLQSPKRYMVGRFMIFRSDRWVDIPKAVIHDDAWLTRAHFPNIQVLPYDFVFYTPSSNPKEWWLRYSRNVASLEQMKETFPDRRLKLTLKPRTNWRALANPLNLPESAYFIIYRLIRKMNKIYYKHKFRKGFNSCWHRDQTT